MTEDQKDVIIVQSLEELREDLTKNTAAHDVTARVYSDSYDPNDPTQDCANLIYHFNYDEAAIEKTIAPSVNSIHEKYVQLREHNGSQISLLNNKINELPLDYASLEDKSSAEEVLAVAYKTVLDVANQKCNLTKSSVLLAIDNIRLEMSEEMEKADVFAKEAVKTMEPNDAKFFPVYLRHKKVLLLTPKILERVSEIEKEFEASISERKKVTQTYLKTYISKVGEKAGEREEKKLLSENEIYAAGLRSTFNQVKNELMKDAEVARIVVFLGKENKKISKVSGKLAKYETKYDEINEKLQPSLALNEVNFDKKVEALVEKKELVKQTAEKELEKLLAQEDVWKNACQEVTKYNDENFKSTLEGKKGELDEKIKSLEKDAEDKISQLTLSDSEPSEGKILEAQGEFDKVCDQILLGIKEGKYENKKQAVDEVNRIKQMAKNLVAMRKVYVKECKAHNESLNDLKKKTLSTHFDKLKALYSARNANKNNVLKEVVTDKNVTATLYYGSKIDLDVLAQSKKEIEEYHQLELSANEEKNERNLNQVRAKFDAKLQKIYNMMRVRKIGVALGRAVSNNKMIDNQYAKLARLQNRTKLVQKNYNDALDGAANTLKNTLDEINNRSENWNFKLDQATTYANNVIEHGDKYAKQYRSSMNKVHKAEEKYKQQYEAEEVFFNTQKNTYIHTAEAWKAKCENERTELMNKSQAIVNSQYLADARAIRVRRFSAKYTLKRLFIRVFCIVAIFTTLGLIQLILPDPLTGFIVGACLALAVELLKYFLSPINYIMPHDGGLSLYNSKGELLFHLNSSDIVNEIMFTKRKKLAHLSLSMIGFEVIVESGADVFRFAIQDKGYRALLKSIYQKYVDEKKQEKKEYFEKVKNEDKELVKSSRTAKAKEIK
ncbi:MAG TPA: hypothetical protein DCY93_02300 [Firmicutes bacterium]|nr:hypothetical protein [Bacillota bacterium]